MKRRVSFLLMLVLAIALAFTLTSCGDCKHEQTETRKEVTTVGNCKTVEVYDEVVFCKDCETEISRTSKKGELGGHVAGEPVYENVDLVDCTKGGTADKVYYCTVKASELAPVCGAEIVEMRENGVQITASAAHSLKTQVVYNKAHTSAQIFEYCENCAYSNYRAPSATEVTAKDKQEADKGHVYQPSSSGICKYCFDVLGDSTRLLYEENSDGGYTLLGVKAGSTLGSYLYVGYYNGKPVTEIAEGAFKNNTNVRNVVIGDQVKKIGKDAFAGCTLNKVYTYNINAWCAIEFANAGANPISVATTFSPNKVDVKNVFSIPSSVSSVSQYAFAGLKVNSIYVPSTVKTVGEGAFAGCTTVKNVYMTGASVSFAKNAFIGCESIVNVYSDSLSAWMKNTFANAEANPVSFADYFYADGKQVTGVLEIPAGETTISSYVFANFDITEVVIPDSVTTIGDGAFAGCASLTKVNGGNGVTTVGVAAFANCTAITEIALPGVTSIGASAFEGVSRLAKITLGANVNFVGEKAFKGCTALASITLPAGVTKLEGEVFANCASLKTVKLEGNVTSIAPYAFSGCSALAELNATETAKVNVPTTVTEIGKGAFANCSSIVSVYVPESVGTIGQGAFLGCSSLEEITLPFIGATLGSADKYYFGYVFEAITDEVVATEENVGGEGNDENEGKEENANTFDNRNSVPYTLAKVVILNAEVVKANAFLGCESIVFITLPANLTKVEASAFAECTSLEEVHFADLTKWLGVEFANYSANPLAYADKLYVAGALCTSITVPETVTEILPYAFYGASSIVEINFANVTKIGKDAFANCTALTNVTFTSAIDAIGARAFFGCDAVESITIASVADWCAVDFADVFANPLFYADNLYEGQAIENELVIPEGTVSIGKYAFINLKVGSVKIANSVTAIGEMAFANCASLTAIDLGTGVITIGDSAFAGCSALTSVVIPESVVAIGKSAFANCVAVNSVVIGNNVETIGDAAFAGCVAMANLTIGANVESIGISAFSGCSALTAVAIPESVAYIGAHAFGDCDALTSVTFAKTTGWVVMIGFSAESGAATEAVEGLDTPEAAAAKLKEYSNKEWGNF